jgi:catechol 2,3-dioxygenase-like lactoylglutathione lyase family enzyme
MRFAGIHHCAVIVSDLERALRFYREVLGLREVHIPGLRASSGYGNICWLEAGNCQIHLLPAPQAEAISQRHVALHVDDAVLAREEVRRRGAEVQESFAIPGADRFFIRDPDGNRIEFIQWKDTKQIVPVNEKE